jgi:hypothetical protein
MALVTQWRERYAGNPGDGFKWIDEYHRTSWFEDSGEFPHGLGNVNNMLNNVY